MLSPSRLGCLPVLVHHNWGVQVGESQLGQGAVEVGALLPGLAQQRVLAQLPHGSDRGQGLLFHRVVQGVHAIDRFAGGFEQNNGKWRARYRDEPGREHAKHFDRKLDAQRWLDQVTAAVVRGDYVDPKAGKTTLTAYAGSWEAVQVSSDSTRRVVDNALRLHLLPELGAYPIAAIRTSQVQGFVKALEAKELSPGSVQLIYHVTAQVFAAAVDDRVISASPCRKIRLPRATTTR